MKYWSGDNILTRDILEGEPIFDEDHPHPAYQGIKILNSGEDYLYEVEIVPNSQRNESIIDPTTFGSIYGTVVDVIHRKWNDNTEQWNELTFQSLLSSWGFSEIPKNDHATQISNFNRAMKGI